MWIERVFEIPPLKLQKSQGLRPGYLYYVCEGDSSIEGVGTTPKKALLDLRATKRRLIRHPSKLR